ncbi:MAG: mycothiol system anti-sigma-R factor [Nocardioides sp.]
MSHSHSEACAAFLDSIVALVDNELDRADVVAVRVHLDECGPCLESYDLQRKVKALVARSCCESAPAGLAEKVRVQIRALQVSYTETYTETSIDVDPR